MNSDFGAYLVKRVGAEMHLSCVKYRFRNRRTAYQIRPGPIGSPSEMTAHLSIYTDINPPNGSGSCGSLPSELARFYARLAATVNVIGLTRDINARESALPSFRMLNDNCALNMIFSLL